MAKLDFNIYGHDETSAAAEIASAALANPHPGNGERGGQASKGGGNDQAVSNADVKIIKGIENDSRARAEGNHGKQG